MTRTLVVPAAGAGTRLRAAGPKLLAPVLGRPMLSHLLGLHRPWVERCVVVVAPAARDAVEQCLEAEPLPVKLAFQDAPTGMLDAVSIGVAAARAHSPARLWITWCDQIAVEPATLEALARHEAAGADLVLPTFERDDPYVHFVRDATGAIVDVAQRREGDALAPRGESDLGLFSLSQWAAFDALPAFAREAPRGAATGERNFLHFVPWLAAQGRVETIAGHREIECIGINTPEERVRVEEHLRGA